MEGFPRKPLLVLGAFLLAAAVLLLPQKQAEGVVATAVQVTNTPLPVQGTLGVNNFPPVQPISGTVSIGNLPAVVVGSSIDEPGRIPYQATVDNMGKCGGIAFCFFDFGFVPSGHRLVVQRVAGYLVGNNSVTSALIYSFQGSNRVLSFFSPPANSGIVAFDQSTHFYADQNTDLLLVAEPFGAGGSLLGDSFSQQLTISGYLLDCTVAACAAIAP